MRAGAAASPAAKLRVGDTDVLALSRHALYEFRGRKVCYIAQSAAAAFNPARRIMAQVIEGALIHGLMKREAAEAKAVELFRALQLPEPERIGERFPHQVSGGQLAAAARGDGADHRSGASGPRRADHRARRDDADRGAARLQAGGARARRDGALCLARSRGGGADRRPCRRAARRADAGGGGDGAADRGTRARIHGKPARRRFARDAGRARAGGGGAPAARDRGACRRLWRARPFGRAGGAGARGDRPCDPAGHGLRRRSANRVRGRPRSRG